MTPQDQSLPLCIFCGQNCPVGFGMCHCGCDSRTSIAKASNPRFGHKFGYPVRYIVGHSGRQKREDLTGAMPFKIEEVYCLLIPLTRGYYTIIDASDFWWVSARYWFARGVGEYIYAAWTDNKNGRSVYLHREIIGITGMPQKGDHENGVTLDNRRKNLRPATDLENARNARKNRANTSGSTGVSFRPERRLPYEARIRDEGRLVYLGAFKAIEEADAAYQRAAQKRFGQFKRKR